ncbi:MAG: hypothetical protein WBH45_01550, partial [Acidobacteriaceae bacterium]
VFENRLKGAENFYYPLLLGYQVRHLEPPKYFEGIVVEVVISQRSLLRFLGAPLDKFSTFGGWGCKLLKVRGGRSEETGDRRQEICGRAARLEAGPSKETQGLKPTSIGEVCGTTEVVP